MQTRASRKELPQRRGRGSPLAIAVYALALLICFAAGSHLLSDEQRVQTTPGRATDRAVAQTGPIVASSTATAEPRESAPSAQGGARRPGQRPGSPAEPRVDARPPIERAAAQAMGSGAFPRPLGARSAVVLDSNGNTLYSLAGNERRYPASTTKVLTALIALEYGSLSDSVGVGEEANLPKPGSSVAGLRYGERLTLEQLLNALLIPSGNDAAYVIAAHIGRKISGNGQMGYEKAIDVFVQRMNSRAKELGAAHSHFANPDGYHDEEHYATASDMALVAREAMTHASFREIVARSSYALPDVQAKDKDGRRTMQHRVLRNTNELLDSAGPYYLRTCTGIKTGHTTEAGYSLISSATQAGRSVLAVVLGSGEESVWVDSAELLQWGLAQR